jgi:2,4-dienoyl-CoA reductase (NADPH2)
VAKAAAGRADEINTCIACNQACLDHVFQRKTCTCLVNPRACHETELSWKAAERRKKVAVVGAGPAGLACATLLAERGHAVDLFDGASEIGGQFNMARRIPGKEEFAETLRYFRRRIEVTGVKLHLGRRVGAAELSAGGFDDVVLATGVVPRDPHILGQEHEKVLTYVDVLAGGKPVGPRVAVVGAGGIGFDVAEFLVHGRAATGPDLAAWMAEWGVVDPEVARGGVATPRPPPPAREVHLLQRKASKPGAGLARTTGWIHRAALKARHVEMLSGVNYERIDGRGLTISFGKDRSGTRLLEVDHVVLCTGQEPLRELQGPLEAAGTRVHLVGGADVAAELDAKRAIDQATRLAASL